MRAFLSLEIELDFFFRRPVCFGCSAWGSGVCERKKGHPLYLSIYDGVSESTRKCTICVMCFVVSFRGEWYELERRACFFVFLSLASWWYVSCPDAT